MLEHRARLGRPPLHEGPLAAARAEYDADAAWLTGPGPPVARVEDRSVDGPGGAIGVRVCWPAGAEPEQAIPVVAYFHGGGWVVGSIDSHDGLCRALAGAAGAIVVSVGYRLAPEHPFPAAVEDAVAVVRWLGEAAGELGGDPRRIAVAGDSAGANLATVAARHARDGGLELAFQALVYPVTDGHGDDDADPEMRWLWNAYAGAAAAGDPDAAPLHADLAGLAPALVLCAEHDELRPEAEAYAAALAAAGVPVELRVAPGTTHGFFKWLLPCGVARRTVAEVGAALRDALAADDSATSRLSAG